MRLLGVLRLDGPSSKRGECTTCDAIASCHAQLGRLDRLTDSASYSQEIEDVKTRKMFFVVRYDHALVRFGDDSNDHIQI